MDHVFVGYCKLLILALIRRVLWRNVLYVCILLPCFGFCWWCKSDSFVFIQANRKQSQALYNSHKADKYSLFVMSVCSKYALLREELLRKIKDRMMVKNKNPKGGPARKQLSVLVFQVHLHVQESREESAQFPRLLFFATRLVIEWNGN